MPNFLNSHCYRSMLYNHHHQLVTYLMNNPIKFFTDLFQRPSYEVIWVFYMIKIELDGYQPHETNPTRSTSSGGKFEY